MSDVSKSDFAWSRSSVSPAATEGDHVGGMQMAEILYEASIEYLVTIFGVSDKWQMSELPVRPILRGISSEFRAELTEGVALDVAVRVRSRSERALVLEGALWRDGDERLVATGTTSVVIFDVPSGRATQIPDPVLAAIEAADGREAPVASRT